MSNYTCHALEEGKTKCNNRCWGQTAYCIWHNCFLTWRYIYLMQQPFKRSAAWIAYDPNLITDWRPPSVLTTANVFTWIFMMFLGTITGWLFNNSNSTKFSLQSLLEYCFWISAALIVLAMYRGNNNSLFPKSLLIIASILIVLPVYGWINAQNNIILLKTILDVLLGVSLLAWAVPPPVGPMRNADADVSDMRQLPPMNIGSFILRTIGIILLAIYSVGYLVMNS